MITSKITSKSQTTIPPAIRQILSVGPGDELVYHIVDGKIVLGRRDPVSSDLAALDLLLTEWADPVNDVYNDL